MLESICAALVAAFEAHPETRDADRCAISLDDQRGVEVDELARLGRRPPTQEACLSRGRGAAASAWSWPRLAPGKDVPVGTRIPLAPVKGLLITRAAAPLVA